MISRKDVRRILGPIGDDKTAIILELAPTLPDIEAAAMCLAGDRDVVVKAAHHTSPLVEAIVEIVAEGEEDAPAARSRTAPT